MKSLKTLLPMALAASTLAACGAAPQAGMPGAAAQGALSAQSSPVRKKQEATVPGSTLINFTKAPITEDAYNVADEGRFLRLMGKEQLFLKEQFKAKYRHQGLIYAEDGGGIFTKKYNLYLKTGEQRLFLVTAPRTQVEAAIGKQATVFLTVGSYMQQVTNSLGWAEWRTFYRGEIDGLKF